MKKILILIPLILLLSGCSSNFNLNEKKNDRSSGYSYTEFSNNNFEVFYTSKKNQSLEKSKDLLLLSSAKLTSEKGFKYFKIIKEDIKNIKKEYKRPVQIDSSYYRHQFWIHDIEVVEIDEYNIYEGSQKIMTSNDLQEDYLDAEKIKQHILSKYKGKLIIE